MSDTDKATQAKALAAFEAMRKGTRADVEPTLIDLLSGAVLQCNALRSHRRRCQRRARHYYQAGTGLMPQAYCDQHYGLHLPFTATAQGFSCPRLITQKWYERVAETSD